VQAKDAEMYRGLPGGSVTVPHKELNQRLCFAQRKQKIFIQATLISLEPMAT